MSEVATRHVKDGASVHLLREQDVEPIIENNKKLQGLGQKSDWGRHIASIPNIFLEKWLNEEVERGNVHMQFGSQEYWRMIAMKLKDPEWKFLRTDAPSEQVGYGK